MKRQQRSKRRRIGSHRRVTTALTADDEFENDEQSLLAAQFREKLVKLHGKSTEDGSQENAAGEVQREKYSRKALNHRKLLQDKHGEAGSLRGNLAVVNDVEGLKRKLEEIAYKPPANMHRVPWIETLAVVAPTPEAETMSATHSDNAASTRAASHGESNQDLFREKYFMEMTSAAALVALRRLRKLRVKFTRPSDFLAEMLKNDAHMARVRATLAQEQISQQNFEKKKHQLVNKKFNKQSGHKLLREQEEARKRNVQLREFEQWKKERARGRDKNDSSDKALVAMAGAGGRGSEAEAALDRWLAERDRKSEKVNASGRRPQRKQLRGQ